MKATTKLRIRENRVFSEEFKRAKVKELIAKRMTIKELCRLYQVSKTSVYKWIYKYSADHQRKPNLVVQMESEAYKTQQLLQRVAELERTIGQKQLEIDFLHKVLELAGREVGFDIKKNFSTQLLNGTASGEHNTPGA